MAPDAARPAPVVFEGVGGVLISDLAAFQAFVLQVPPARLVELMAEILGVQEAIILRHGARIEQFVGDCVLAYWPPAEPAQIAAQALAAARELAATRLQHAEFRCHLKVGFAVAECAGAFLGSAPNARFQVIGRARSRAEHAVRTLGRQGGAATDEATHALFGAPEAAGWERIASGSYLLRNPPTPCPPSSASS
jgi:class 3 adenylate cyclase